MSETTGYTKVSNFLLQNYELLGMDDIDLAFMLRVMSNGPKKILNDSLLGYKETKARRIRAKLKKLKIIKVYTIKGVGSIYYVLVDTIQEAEQKYLQGGKRAFAPQNGAIAQTTPTKNAKSVNDDDIITEEIIEKVKEMMGPSYYPEWINDKSKKQILDIIAAEKRQQDMYRRAGVSINPVVLPKISNNYPPNMSGHTATNNG